MTVTVCVCCMTGCIVTTAVTLTSWDSGWQRVTAGAGPQVLLKVSAVTEAG